MRFTKLGRSHLEIIFKSFTELCHYISSGITILGQTHMGYYASTGDRNYLNITLKNMPIMDPESVTNEIKKFFDNICTVASIKPLIYAGTKFLFDQWQITLDITDREEIIKSLPRCIKILGNKITLS